MNHSLTKSWRFVFLLGLIIIQPVTSHAQEAGFRLDHYRAAEAPYDGFVISRPDDMGHLHLGAQLHLDYAYDVLLLERIDGSGVSAVEHMLVADLGLSLGVAHRVVIFLGFPFNLVMTGDAIEGDLVRPADGTTIGDLRAGARIRLFGEADDLLAIGFQAGLSLPTAAWAQEGQSYAGDVSGSGQIELLGEIRADPVRITINVGARFGKTLEYQSFVSGNALSWGLGVTWDALEILEVLAELWGSSPFTAFGDPESTPVEAIGGLRFFPGHGLVLGFAVGAGLTSGVGSPRFRTAATLGWSRAMQPVPEDLDGDGLINDVDQCPQESEDTDGFEDHDGCPDPDNDQDGVQDGDDICPNDAEDEDQFEDDDGCPDYDNDDDGVVDSDDLCPNDAEDVDAFEDEDGCPDPDNDDDGISDTDDRCPNEAEDMDRFEDDDGCPDSDNDDDGVPDSEDQCPLAPGPRERDGCPDSLRLDPTTGIQLMQRIRFESNRATLHPTATPILDDVVAVLLANPQIERVIVEGHTDGRGTEEYNRELSQRRALAVVEWIIERGVARDRLEPRGIGEDRPIETNETEEGRRANRRVEFRLHESAESW